MTGKELLNLLQRLPEDSLMGEVTFKDSSDYEYCIHSIQCTMNFNKTEACGHIMKYNIELLEE